MNTSSIQLDRPSRRDSLRTRTNEQPPVSTSRFSAWGLALVELAIGYEWLISGLNKVYSSTFRAGLAASILTSLQDNPNGWWVALMQRWVIPNASLWGTLVEGAELFVALGLFAGALLWISGCFPMARFARHLNVFVLIALLGGLVMTLNYYLLAGHPLADLGRLNPGAPFDEGLSLDGLLTFIGVGLLLIHLMAQRGHAGSSNAQAIRILKHEAAERKGTSEDAAYLRTRYRARYLGRGTPKQALQSPPGSVGYR